MATIHTMIAEMYTRMWIVYKVDKVIIIGIHVFGLFGVYRWNFKKLTLTTNIETKNS